MLRVAIFTMIFALIYIFIGLIVKYVMDYYSNKNEGSNDYMIFYWPVLLFKYIALLLFILIVFILFVLDLALESIFTFIKLLINNKEE